MTSPATAPWHPDKFVQRRAYLKARQQAIAAMRGYFTDHGFDEVDTPALQISPGNEVHLQAFKTELGDPHGGAAQTFYLHTSPEFAMKKLLVAGLTKIFQFAHVFRNNERSSRHHPEFTMLEWYRADADLTAIMDDCIALVRAAALATNRKVFSGHGMECNPFRDWETLSVPDAFDKYAEINLLATAPDPYAPEAVLLAQAAEKLGIRVARDDSWDDIFFRIMAEKIEPELGRWQPTFLCDYPVSMAALARPKAQDPRLAERTELYICGYEIANGFGELTDADEQERRFTADMATKERLYGERFPIDSDFIAALRHGMPESAGIALGLDRLIMLCAGTEQIDDVLWLPVAGLKS
jgi:lysyl-tRNA synthetase class 2